MVLIRLEDLLKMGSFTSAPKIINEDSEDNDLELPEKMTKHDLLMYCRDELIHFPPPFNRKFHYVNGPPPNDNNSKNDPERIRVMQWNILSQALGENNDGFVACPEDALSWRTRRWRILEEILSYNADILCLQEVDHYNFFKKTLGQIGYNGTFFPKPDSPCYYIKGNNGPDGCAIFYDSAKFELIRTETRVLEVWTCQSNQVAILCILRNKQTGKEFCVATTHLKARSGSLLSTLRNEQGKDLVDFIKLHYGCRPLIVCGDFNAEPTEPVYKTMTSTENLGLTSGCRYLNNRLEEPKYTTWKIREEGEVCHTIDYVFFSSNMLDIESVLSFPSGEDIGEGRIPSYQYASDHFSLVCDFRLKPGWCF